MKIRSLALLACAFLTCQAHAQSSVTLYGILDEGQSSDQARAHNPRRALLKSATHRPGPPESSQRQFRARRKPHLEECAVSPKLSPLGRFPAP
jgi:hypothetical protein